MWQAVLRITNPTAWATVGELAPPPAAPWTVEPAPAPEDAGTEEPPSNGDGASAVREGLRHRGVARLPYARALNVVVPAEVERSNIIAACDKVWL